VLDSSVLVKLVLSEESSDEAKTTVTRILDAGGAISTTESALPEAGNAIWKQAHLLHQLDAAGYHTAMDSAIRLITRMRLIPTTEVAGDAAEIAINEGVTFYDSLYIAAAQQTGSRLLTADKRQHQAARGRAESTLIGRTNV
jgi:predicted nucleic acid-binding protein